MSRGRAFRRLAMQVKKAWAKYVVSNIWKEKVLANDKRRIGIMASTPHPCSCDMCRNQRSNRWSKGKDRPTLQEKRAMECFQFRDDTYFDNDDNSF